MKTCHCIFDATILVDCDIYGQRADRLERGRYRGPRLVACNKFVNCSRCGWNPMVEEKRKAKGLHPRHGYIDSNGVPTDQKYIYKGIKINED